MSALILALAAGAVIGLTLGALGAAPASLPAGTVEGLDWAVVGLFTGVAILGVWGGERLPVKVSGPMLQQIFALVLLVLLVLLAVAAFILIDALP